MVRSYTTRDRDMIDMIAHTHYGYSRGAAEAILAANPTLARMPIRLPPGIKIVLPDVATPTSPQPVRLWD